MAIKHILVTSAPPPGGTYSHGASANGFLYTCGMGPIDPSTGKVVGEQIEEQTRQVMRNLETILAAEALTLSDVVKVTTHLHNLERDFAGFNRAYTEFFTGPAPARTTVGSQLMNILLEVDVVAAYRKW